jgi:hypothetical protein
VLAANSPVFGERDGLIVAAKDLGKSLRNAQRA